MATINSAKSYPQKFNFIGDPVMVYASGSFPSASTFRKLVFNVYVTFQNKAYEYPFSVSVEADEEIGVDVSSALRSVMSRWDYPLDAINQIAQFTQTVYPSATFSVGVYEKYMSSGTICEKQEVMAREAYAYYGRWGEYNRMALPSNAGDFADSLTFSTYPGEKRYGAGDWLSASSYLDGEVETNFTVQNEGVLKAGKYLHFLFVNSMGVLETVSAVMRETMNYTITTTTYSVERAPSYEVQANRMAISTPGRSIFEMSSGYVTRIEADWWATEFLTARKHWVRLGIKRTIESGQLKKSSLWLPVAVTPKGETVTIYNKEERALPHIDFTAEVAVSGSLLTTPGGAE